MRNSSSPRPSSPSCVGKRGRNGRTSVVYGFEARTKFGGFSLWFPARSSRKERQLAAGAGFVTQIFNRSVSVQIVAGRDDFAERGSVSRSTLRATDALELSKRWAAGQAPAGHRPALLWLRLRRAGMYRRVLLCQP